MTDGTFIIAIDGPAGSGKSSVSKEVARTRGYGYLDTGAVYRALAWSVLETGSETSDEAAVLAALADFEVAIGLDPDVRRVSVSGRDVTEPIRDPRVSSAVSGVARIPLVRDTLNRRFHQIVQAADVPAVLIEGRDITTVVAPDAPVRILLTADAEVRASRRAKELLGHDAAQVAADLRQRDAKDAQVVDFLTPAPGVTVVDSTDLDFDGTVAAVIDVIDRLSTVTRAESTEGTRDV